MPLQAFTLSTWNLQKGPALENLAKTNIFAAAARSARHQIIGSLAEKSDIVFVQEPPTEIRDETQQIDYDAIETQQGVWVSYNRDADNQVHKSANRPAYFSNKFGLTPLQVPSDCPVNGKDDSFRLSAMGYACTNLGYAIFVSLHATSGAGAERNTRAFLEWLSKWVPAEHAEVRFVLIGADFNHDPFPRDVTMENNCRAQFSLPSEMTQQSGGAIDGFCCLTIDPAIKVKWRNAQRLCTGELNSPIETKMVKVNPNIQQGFNERGYLGKLSFGPMPGTSQPLRGSDMWIRMSDHCAVMGVAEISCP